MNQETNFTIAVADWKSRFENSRSREVQALTWHRMPVLLADPVYATIVSEEGGPAIFGAFVALVQVAAQGTPRGTISFPNGKPHTPKSLALLTRMPLELIENTLKIALELGWFVRLPESADEVPSDCLPTADDVPNECDSGGRLKKEIKKEIKKGKNAPEALSNLSEDEAQEFQELAGKIFKRHQADRRGGSEQIFLQELISYLENDARPLQILQRIDQGHKKACESKNWREGYSKKLVPWITSGDWENADEYSSSDFSGSDATPLYVEDDAA